MPFGNQILYDEWITLKSNFKLLATKIKLK